MRTRWKALPVLAPFLVGVGCGTGPEGQVEGQVETQSSALSASDHFYLRCNVTSWELNDKSFMTPTGGDGRLRVVEFTVDEDWELTGNTCQPMSTDVLGQWGSAPGVYTTVHGAVTAPGADQLTTGYQQIPVKFPSLGRYRATINAGNGSFLVEPVVVKRRGLGVITNFQNRTIGDHTGPGINSEADLRSMLDRMEAHWKWLSRGTEEMRWDIVQVTLPQTFSITRCHADADCAAGTRCQTVSDDGASQCVMPCTQDGNNTGCLAGETCHHLQDERNGTTVRSWNQCEPYSWWGDYRQKVIDATIAELNRTGVDPAVYDFDKDGDIDAIWSIIADNGTRLDSMIGGSSGPPVHVGGQIFVDGQASESVVRGSYGNFNHELGHLRGLPDLYGKFSTVMDLTLMAYSWALPPHDFDAYSRTRMGWASPREIRQSTQNIKLTSANDALDVVMVPTIQPREYFLIEYRVTPAFSSFGGSAPQGLNGLIVYHVLEQDDDHRCEQGINPPCLKVESPDLSLYTFNSRGGWETTADQSDALTPTNVSQQTPFIVRSYASNNEVFRITRVANSGSSMYFDITVAP